MADLVSVITPAFNAAPWIGEAIASVQAQSHPRWELLIVDDGSTDSTAEIVAEYAAADGRIHLFRQANSGLPAIARNRALAEATGDWIAFLDSDDLWLPEKLEAQLRLMAGSKGWCFSNIEHFGTALNQPMGPNWPKDWRPPVPYFREALLNAGPPNIGVFVHRELLRLISPGDDISRAFDTTPEPDAVVEDWLLCLRLAKQCEPRYDPAILGRYRHLTGSVSSAGERPFERALNTIQLLESEGLSPDLVRRARRLQESKIATARLVCGRPDWRPLLRRSTTPPASLRDLYLYTLSWLPESMAQAGYKLGLNLNRG
jgi:glycosyltransferase involved in cell wall biosynthesis